MRVIAGSAKHLQLKSIEGLDTRPTTDRIKETLFNIIAPGLYDCEFLDLFAGSGGIGIEALSRGGRETVFIEQNPKAIQCIRENLAFTRLEEKAQVIKDDVFSALRRIEGQRVFDYIFMDPPYGREYERLVLEYLSHSSLLNEDTVVIVEASKETDFSYLKVLGYRVLKEKIYKTNKHVFLCRGSGCAA